MNIPMLRTLAEAAEADYIAAVLAVGDASAALDAASAVRGAASLAYDDASAVYYAAQEAVLVAFHKAHGTTHSEPLHRAAFYETPLHPSSR